MADMLHAPKLPNFSTFSHHSPLNPSPHPHSSIRFAPLRRLRRFSPFTVLAKFSDPNFSQFDIVSKTELSDGSVCFKFGDASAISEIVEHFVGESDVELERESDDVLAREDDKSDRTKAEEFELNSVALREISDDNTVSIVDLVSEVEICENSVDDERKGELISTVVVESSSDLDAVKYKDQVVTDVVATCGSSVDVENENAGGLSEVIEETDDDKLDHGGDELSNVGGTNSGAETSGEVVSLEDDFVKEEILEDEIVENVIEKDEIAEDKIVKDEVVSVEDEIVEDGIVKHDHVEDEVVFLEDEIVKDGMVEDEVVSLEDDITKDEPLQDEIVSLKNEIVNDGIVTDNIVKDEVVSLIDEIAKDDIVKTVKDEIVENEVVSLKDKTVTAEILEDEVVSLRDGTMKDDIVEDEAMTLKDKVVSLKYETVKDEIIEDEVVSLKDETVEDGVLTLKETVVSLENEIVKDNVVSSEVEIEKDESAEDKNVKDIIAQVNIEMDDSEEDENVKGGIVADEIVEDSVVLIEDKIEGDKVISLEDETEEDRLVSLEDETENSSTVFAITDPILLGEDDDSVKLMSKKLEAEPINSFDDGVALGSSLGFNKVHDAVIHTIADSGDVTNMLVSAGSVKSGITSPETSLNRKKFMLNKVEPSAPAFSISSAVATLAHSHEALTGRKDAYFVFENWFGVADGVGQWSLGGVDIGLYAHELMQNCEKLLKSTSGGLINAKELLQQSAAMTQSTGSARVLIAQVANQVLHVANIGDSGFIIIRNGTIFQKSLPMVHEFSFPYAIGLGDDSVEDVEEYHIELEDGDMIVTATDGLFDNLYEHEIAFLVSKAVEAGVSLQDLAEVLATKAEEVGRSGSARSPFADAAQAAGHTGYSGGKLDHVTVIVSLVQRR